MNTNRYQQSLHSSIHSYLEGNTPSFELDRHDSEFKAALSEYIDVFGIKPEKVESLNVSDTDGLSKTLVFLGKRSDAQKDSIEYRQVLVKMIEAAQTFQNENIKANVLAFVSDLPE